MHLPLACLRHSRSVVKPGSPYIAKAKSTAQLRVCLQRPAGISWAAAGGILLAGLGSYAYVQTTMMQKKREALANLETSVGEAQVGGPFTLTDTSGRKFDSAQLHGEFAILYFGFTHCPDICPDELEKMAAALDLVGAHAAQRTRLLCAA